MRPKRVSQDETQISGREVELLVVLRIVGDVHLPVFAEEPAVGIDDGRGVVIESFGALLEQRGDDHDAQLGGQLAQRLGRRARNRLGQLEEPVVFGLAEILAAEELLEADDLGAATGGLADPLTAFPMLASGSGVQLICTRPRVTVLGAVGVVMRG